MHVAAQLEAKMSEYLTEQEQIELIKKYWATYKRAILAGVFISLIGWFSYHAWYSYRLKTNELSSTSYQTVLDKFLAGSWSNINIDDIKNKTYLQYWKLVDIAHLVNQGDVNAAIQGLTGTASAKDHGDASLDIMTSLRLARLYYDDEQFDKVVSVIDGIVNCNQFQSECFEIKGDALRKLNDSSGAKTAYDAALAVLSAEDAEKKNKIDMKKSDLAY